MKPDLTARLRKVGGGTYQPALPEPVAASLPETSPEVGSKTEAKKSPTAAITVHYPPEVRQQLKLLAVQQGAQMQDLIGEALNDLFMKYRLPEIAPVKKRGVHP